jgi:hypothetical protein
MCLLYEMHNLICSSILLPGYVLYVVFGMTFLSLCPTVQHTEVGIPSSSCCRHTVVKFAHFLKNIKCSIYGNSVICCANYLYGIITKNLCYKMCFFADVSKGSPFISGTFFFDEMFDSLLPMKTFCVVWTDCS